MRLEDVLEIGEAGPLPLVGVGVLTLVLPFYVPSLRPELGGILKASVKLFLEAELGADNQLTDELVDRSVDALLRSMPEITDQERHSHTERELERFFSRARAAAHRRGFNREDAKRRYKKHLDRMERTLTHRQRRAATGSLPYEHALRRIANERRRSKEEQS